MAQTWQPTSGPTAGLVRRLLPPPALFGFLVLLVLVFSVSYAAGRSAGPVAPGMHVPGITEDGGTDTVDDDMGGMNHGSGR
ncbi:MULTISPECIES: hypothetical protein [Streptomyces]|uniref:Secreted protein n=1 Tax=Streptomyces edwardsiae TaxID=3075527 RepID=A0ABU2PNI5_9ACTN|nr:hypothetical protein [Streptomyces sp. DSM 41636]MDT0393728.1 hypothetical protein [Streptomyces sp. DSM 41636]